ncbi:Flp pilus assembly protein CpaB [Pseudomonas sp. NW5]|uniref:Flp pilus assembly protein CpaB n=1 Tax=Pseudomonas sp. NW5 TaxID=2934934 RepID=UPI0020203AED|nr:Flp pilus assembly protein CpaB [Pseudomonas sp. NW5]MCL7461214.1 Flp pilus assembly protein CpaB [Pseudomonas sp. NW5]
MKLRTLLLLGFSVLFALAAVWLANTMLESRLAVREQAEDVTEVMVAALPIPFGRTIEERHLRAVSLPRNATPADSFANVGELIGKVATAEILEGDVVRRARVSEHLGGSTLAALIEPNKRALTVRVNDVIGVGGFLLPGNRVDVLAARSGNSDVAQVRTVLENLRVLAVDQTVSTNKTDPVLVRAVTLEMTLEEAEKLFKAETEGRLQLALRNPLDDSRLAVEPPPSAPAPAVAAPTPPKAAPVVRRSVPAPVQITIIRGTSIERQGLQR